MNSGRPDATRALPPERQADLERLTVAAREVARDAAIDQPLADLLVETVTRLGTAVLGLNVSQPKASEPTVVEFLDAIQGSWAQFTHRLSELAEAETTRPEPWGTDWWHMQRAQLAQALDRDALGGTDRWRRLFTSALIEGHTDVCERLLVEPFGFPPETAQHHAVLREGVRALSEQRNRDAVPMLVQLAQTRSLQDREPMLGPTDRALLRVFAGHAFLSAGDVDCALPHLERARRLAPADGRPRAALGDYYRARALADGSRDRPVARLLARARRHYEQARQLSPGEPEGYIGLGLLREEEELWLEADDLYEQAAWAFADDLRGPKTAAVVGRRLGPTSGNLLLQVARSLDKQGNLPGALDAVEHALLQPIRGEGLYSERIGYRLQAEVLEKLRRWGKCAEAYFNAGARFGWRGDHQVAVELLTKSRRYDRKRTATYWHLSDSLAASSREPTAPFVDKDKLAESLEIWDAAGRLPEPPLAWAYLTRAYISEQMARLPGQDQQRRWWEAVTYAERALMLGPEDDQNWRFLSVYYGRLGLQVNAREAARTAFKLDASLDAADSMVSSLANCGLFDEARTWLRRYRRLLTPSAAKGSPEYSAYQWQMAWYNAVEGFMLLREGDYEAAGERLRQTFAYLSRASVPEADHPLWFYEERALCRRMLGEWTLSEKDNRIIWSRFHLQDRDNQSYFGRAAYSLGRLHDAIKIFRRLCDELDDGPAHIYLGLSLIAFGDLDQGERELRLGIEKTNNKLQLDDLLRFEFTELQKFIALRADGPALRDALDRLTARVTARRAEVERTLSPMRELKDARSDLEARGETTGPAWIGVHAGLARQCVERRRWEAARRTFHVLREAADGFPEIGRAVDAALASLMFDGDRAFGEGDTVTALVAYRSARRLAHDSGAFPARAAEIEARLSTALWATDDAAARDHLALAIEWFREAGVPEPGRAVAAACRPLLRDVAHYWALDAAWEASGAKDVAAAREELTRFLDDRMGLGETFVGAYDTRPVLEIGSGLVPLDTGPSWSLFATLLPAMRARLEEELGLRLAGVSVRSSNDLPYNGYGVYLNGFPVVRGATVPLDLRFTDAPAPVSEPAGDGGPIPPAADPVSGAPLTWVGPAASERVPDKGSSPPQEPLAFVVRHLEAALRQSLQDYMGLDEFDELLKPVWCSEAGAVAVAAVAPDLAARCRLSRVLRALLREQVPIVPLEPILDAVSKAGAAGQGLDEAVCAARLRMRDRLPGNTRDAARVPLPRDLEEELAKLLHDRDGTAAADTEPQAWQVALLAISKLLGQAGPRTVLVTGDPRLRPYLRRLIEARFPSVMVLSTEEALPQEAAADA